MGLQSHKHKKAAALFHKGLSSKQHGGTGGRSKPARYSVVRGIFVPQEKPPFGQQKSPSEFIKL